MKTACELLSGLAWLSLISGCSSGQDSSTDVPFIAPFTGVGVSWKSQGFVGIVVLLFINAAVSGSCAVQ